MPSHDWRTIVDSQLASKETRTPRRSIAVNYPDSLYSLILEAAKGRAMSMTAYQRRAALAVARYDLGFDWATELCDEPGIATFVGGRAATEYAGFGFGPWLITGMLEATDG